jgi:hypothetical protein
VTLGGGRALRATLTALVLLAACGGGAALHAPDAGAGAAGGGGGAAGAVAGSSGGAGTSDGGTSGAGTSGAAGAPTDDAGSAGGAPDDGPPLESDAGPPAPQADAGLEPEGGVVLPPYDGGIVSVINASNWDETTKFPFSRRRMLVRDEGDPHLVLLDLGATPAVVWKQVTDGPWGRGIQLIGNNQVMGSRSDGYDVFDLTTGQTVKSVKSFPLTTSAYRMANGETLLTQPVPGPPSALAGVKLSFLDKADRISRTITYPGFSYVRMTRPTRDQTFLVPCDTTLFEGDAAGNVLWKATGTGWAHVWEPFLMADGNVILATFFGSSLDVVDRTTHTVTKRYGGKTMPMAAMFRPNGFAEFQILPNGNLITSNWQGHGGGNGSAGIQVIEFDPAGDVVWYYKQDPTVFAAIQGVMVIDGMNPTYLHAQEISPDSTWQPVMPTP